MCQSIGIQFARLLNAFQMYSDRPTVLATPNDPASRGVHFMNEALRLWALEEGRVTLTNLQSLLIMSIG
jgi:hypothetical protein